MFLYHHIFMGALTFASFFGFDKDQYCLNKVHKILKAPNINTRLFSWYYYPKLATLYYKQQENKKQHTIVIPNSTSTTEPYSTLLHEFLELPLLTSPNKDYEKILNCIMKDSPHSKAYDTEGNLLKPLEIAINNGNATAVEHFFKLCDANLYKWCFSPQNSYQVDKKVNLLGRTYNHLEKVLSMTPEQQKDWLLKREHLVKIAEMLELNGYRDRYLQDDVLKEVADDRSDLKSRNMIPEISKKYKIVTQKLAELVKRKEYTPPTAYLFGWYKGQPVYYFGKNKASELMRQIPSAEELIKDQTFDWKKLELKTSDAEKN